MAQTRKPRESEKALANLWQRFPHLQVCVWYPLREDAIKHAHAMRAELAKLIAELEKESDKS